MEQLWQKERSQTSTSYVDLFASTTSDHSINENLAFTRSAISKKNNQISTSHREDGNKDFNYGILTDALNKYISSLCFAEIGTENVALAYAERSAYFYRTRMYKEALADIELAKNAGVPDHLLKELEKRQENCSSLINSRERRKPYVLTPILSYAPHEHYPGLANVVNLKYNAEFGRHYVANSDIPPGKVIVTDEAFAVNHLENVGVVGVCRTCFLTLKNFIACEQCVYVVFCSPECKNKNQTHAYECGTFLGFTREAGDVSAQRQWLKIKLVIQTFLNALCCFSNVEELMEFVENTLREDPDKLPKSMNDTVSKYHFFLKLNRTVGKNVILPAKDAYKLAMELPKIRALFDTDEKQRFLMHLITYHSWIYYSNGWVHGDGSVVSNISSMFNHSCEPNAKTCVLRNLMVAETTQPIKKGEQILVNYLGDEYAKLPVNDRYRQLMARWGFCCKCTKCESERAI